MLDICRWKHAAVPKRPLARGDRPATESASPESFAVVCSDKALEGEGASVYLSWLR